MGWYSNLRLRWKLVSAFGAVVVLLGGTGGWTALQMRTLNAAYGDLVQNEGSAATTAQVMRVLLLQQVQAEKNVYLRGIDPKQYDQFATEFDARAADMAKTRAEMNEFVASGHLTSDEQDLLKRFDAGWNMYTQTFAQAKEAYGGPGGGNIAAADKVMSGKSRDAVAAGDALAASLSSRRDQIADALSASAARQLMLVCVAVAGAAVLALVIAVVIAMSLARRIGRVTVAAQRVARGDLGYVVADTSRDELGLLAGAFREMVAGQREMADVAEAVAGGDLSQAVQPRSAEDALGHAFGKMIANLRKLVGEVQMSATQVAGTSDLLGSAATQTGTAVQQVTQAVQELASGAQQTSTGAQDTSAAVGDLTQAIDGIARGAADQARQVQSVTTTASEMADGVDEVARVAKQVASASEQTRAAAAHGGEAVRGTVEAIGDIQTVVRDATDKILDLGSLGEKIGAVVQTIDDVAEQTNLLALNAAIEAARAGEHGRGFAVVADEVRKLAERSSRETRQIAELIAQVQAGTRQAVDAIERGASSVSHGADRAAAAGEALDAIGKAVEASVTQVGAIAESAQRMAVASREVTAAVQSISAVVEENSASAEQMAVRARQVSVSVQSIAAVAEEQTAGTEEVSASAEEMSAQVEEMSAQAQELAETAGRLQELVRQFRLEAQGADVAELPTQLRAA
ncbi:MAG: methyl-accepting chemotaxis protein [Chloroflexi bacterium]|nr:methyl-accepting chemotaxis protein [Chloroflexota bacterium]